MIWAFVKSYKGMFWYETGCGKVIVQVCVSGNLYRNTMQPAYMHIDFLSEFICDNEIDIDEVVIGL